MSRQAGHNAVSAIHAMSADLSDLISLHLDAIDGRRFKAVHCNGSDWTLSHLDPFAFRVSIEPELVVDVVVIFSCHCFTHDRADDKRWDIAPSELYSDQWEAHPRVLNPERYRLSRVFLPAMIRDLPKRRIRVEEERKNYFTVEATDSEGKAVFYLVYFEVKKDSVRKKRLILRVQTAFPVEDLGKRRSKAGKVNFEVLLRAAYHGRAIRG